MFILENQKNFIEYTEKVENVISPISVIQKKEDGQAFSQIEKLKSLQQKIKSTELIVPIVGGFSAGKSSLINSFLGGNILPIGIQPETALPAELRYSTTDYIEAVTANNRIDKYNLTDFDVIKQKIKSEEYRYLKIYLNNQNLKDIQPLVLVDMPGYSSPVQGHNSVIMDYTAKGIFFIFLSSVETQGTLQGNILDELSIINGINKGFSFCLSKTNLKAPSQVEEIKEEVIDQLHDVIDNFDENVVLLDNNSGENLKKIIQSINPNELFKKVFLEELDDNYIESEKLIKKYINHLQRDSEVLELAIKEIEEGFQRIEQQKQNAIQEVRSQNTEQAKYFIINKVTETIMDRREYLAQLALNNKYQFQEELNETVRNNLSFELKKYLKEMSDKAIYDFQSEIDSLNFLKEFDPNLVDDIVAKIQKDIEKSDTSIDLGEITSGIATLIGLLTGTVGAILKTVLDVLNKLPILSNILSSIFSSSNDERYKAEAARQEAIYKIEGIIAKDIVMKIKSSLEREIPKILTNALESMVATIANEFNQQMKSAQTAQKDALEVKNRDRASIEQNIQQLETVLSQLANLKQQYLK